MRGMTNPDTYPGLPFLKMHGLGNDFVVIDGRADLRPVTIELVSALADRHTGVGFDQLAVIENDYIFGSLMEGEDELPNVEPVDLAIRFFNADGTTAGACGNATRCIARREMELTGKHRITLRTERGLLEAVDAGDGLTSVNMGHPVMTWKDIPLKGACDTLHLPIDGAPVATGMGNPHCSFFVDDADAVDLETLGAKYERHPLFPQRTNVQFAHVIGPDHLRMRVWERGVGVTLASGSSSCAVAVAAARRGLTGRKVRLTLDGGDIHIDWRDDGVWMTGPTAHVFSGELTPAFLDAL